jgi:hypothetical protein
MLRQGDDERGDELIPRWRNAACWKAIPQVADASVAQIPRKTEAIRSISSSPFA